ncbi:nucleotidyltransferase family protein [Pendulispora brunnea]|uniref:Nucleotidyltransferase family protein n=1 Tax=Pendulispora brunnea TaxID=2905690 RepID=A0ABZ2KH22_9BACT
MHRMHRMHRDVAERAAIWSQHEHARRVLERVLRACEADGIRALPVKGILTARWLYDDPSERRIQDIDLRVTPRDFARLEALGHREGFPILEVSRASRNIVFDVDGMMVEFEAHIGPRGLCNLPIETMLSRASVHEAPFGFSHLQPDMHDHALLLVVNVYKDKIVGAAEWALRDLELLPLSAGFDPARLAALATEHGVAALTWLVADWLAERGAPRWEEVRTRLANAPRHGYRRAVRALMHDHGVLFKPAPHLLLRILARAASDQRKKQLEALGFTVAWSLEKRIRAFMQDQTS